MLCTFDKFEVLLDLGHGGVEVEVDGDEAAAFEQHHAVALAQLLHVAGIIQFLAGLVETLVHLVLGTPQRHNEEQRHAFVGLEYYWPTRGPHHHSENNLIIIITKKN